MENFIILGLGWAGIFLPTALGAIGSIVGCARAGQAACGALLDVESGYGRLVGASALPSSQTIYGIVVTMQLNRTVTILEVAGRAAPPADHTARILLPKDVVGMEQLRRNPEEVKEGTLSHFVVTVTKEVLREGIEIGARDDEAAGIRIHLEDDDLEIDLTDRAVADLLLRHLVPRFRAMMEGIIQ